MSAAPLIVARGLCKYYASGEARFAAVDHISLDVAAGDYVALVGASGSGKSTLMHMLGCLDTPDAGHLSIAGHETAALAAKDLARVRQKAIGFVFQQFNLLPLVDALDNVALPLLYQSVTVQDRRARARAQLEALGLGHRAHHRPLQLSGGQQQRVAIARALVGAPQLLLADEPTGALDSQTSMEILDIFDRLHKQGLTILLVTHDLEVAARARRRISMRDGRIVEDSDHALV